ncbi:chromosome segregation protein [Clostridium moniliforme]|uniref:Chromosome partition protein Smc n=1 Tax=Clostridium moniliforme TaxID=39489 RepID=A0ABS4EX30_9CLOT|nr:chromosome segregation protein SMC [Clostridium moniliforme]MBP1888538.1 chromosome segregation protein [Clostridium moniliforme]
MFLKSLELRGFKSFADKTEFKFKKGVTAVVGPNGSGKSNISDAVRWVLGEQSVKTLRGGKMEDVIFSGTQYRKPLGLAQVSITLDNSDEVLKTDYNEVKVTRRIFRSGETEYLLNNNKCRLKDIINLFMDTGIGKEGYSLIGQGKIEAILSGKAEDRRALLEEAAGIVKYKYRKNEAEKKLSNTDDNLVRIRDIISTYEERLEPLKIEMEKALKFKDLSNELREKEVSLIVNTIKNIEKDLNVFNEDLNNRIKEINLKKEKLKLKREDLKNIEENIEELDRKTTDKKLEYFTKKEDITKAKSDIELFNERIKNLNSILEKNKFEEYGINSKNTDLHKEKELLQKQLLNKKEEEKNINEEILKLEEKNKALNLKINNLEYELKTLKNNELELLRGNSNIKNKITEVKSNIKGKEERKDRIDSSLKNIDSNIKINRSSFNGLKLKIESEEKEFEILKEKLYSNKQSLGKLNNIFSKKENEIKAKNISLSKLQANKTILEGLENQYEGYNRSLKNLMESVSKNLTPHTKGIEVLGEIFEVPKGYETAIETSLGSAISNVITDTENVAKDLIEYLKKNKLGRITFLPLNIINGKRIIIDNRVKEIDGYLGIASEIVKFDSKYTKIMDYSLGRTLICTNMESAFKIAKITNYKNRIVTLEGEVLNAGGALTGGSIKGKASNILSRKREIDDLKKRISIEKEILESLSKELEKLKNERKTIDEKILNYTDKAHEIKIEIVTNKSELSNLENEIKKLNINLNSLQDEKKSLDEEILSLNKKLEEYEYNLNKLTDENSLNKERAVELENIIEKEKEYIKEYNLKLTDVRIAKASADADIQNKINEIIRKDNEFKDGELKIEKIKKENKEALEDINRSKKEIEEKKNIIEENSKRIIILEEIFKEDEINKIKFKEEFRKIDSLIIEMREIINKEEGELNKREILKAKSEMEIENYYKKLNEELDLTYEEALEIAKPIENLVLFKENVHSIKRRISSLGTVNLAAISEYEEVSEKYNFMTSQEQDLEKAKEELISVISEMTSKMKVLFNENFKILNKNFNETFRELFKGGSAELILGEGDELTCNIEINVMPPGKKLQNINLMSGGEKVLSAIALLFGILKMKPTPFCILDEIEAALDDANVYRYAEFLKKFSEKNIQFIVITHRKGTMEVSDIMYGITMEEKGISKVVSVDLTK